jgi:hypothetical protein
MFVVIVMMVVGWYDPVDDDDDDHPCDDGNVYHGTNDDDVSSAAEKQEDPTIPYDSFVVEMATWWDVVGIAIDSEFVWIMILMILLDGLEDVPTVQHVNDYEYGWL